MKGTSDWSGLSWLELSCGAEQTPEEFGVVGIVHQLSQIGTLALLVLPKTTKKYPLFPQRVGGGMNGRHKLELRPVWLLTLKPFKAKKVDLGLHVTRRQG